MKKLKMKKKKNLTVSKKRIRTFKMKSMSIWKRDAKEATMWQTGVKSQRTLCDRGSLEKKGGFYFIFGCT